MKEVNRVSKEQQNDVVEELVADETVESQETAEAGQNEAEVVDARYAELEKQLEESQQRYLRTQADFDNFRRRSTKEREELARYASMKLVTELLPVVDNFDRATAAASVNGDVEALAKGVDMIFRQLTQTLEQEGLTAMNVVGEAFNPDFHQAIMTVESDEYEEGIIVEEVQKGYMLKEKVLRPAMVKVSG
ncbi:nucleotide exchange factor GrpE [Paenibacillus sp. BIHB 4019]|uniref:Protein GrpE n=1 Tax=Paenibacillus sp. BIHB 4019 TaxID=1870819 RepID=A0A1B2DLK0_9BACL|nr:nucleotide exchange factor GrpE [Paenibacillus sp. BIHB 4019]